MVTFIVNLKLFWPYFQHLFRTYHNDNNLTPLWPKFLENFDSHLFCEPRNPLFICAIQNYTHHSKIIFMAKVMSFRVSINRHNHSLTLKMKLSASRRLSFQTTDCQPIYCAVIVAKNRLRLSWNFNNEKTLNTVPTTPKPTTSISIFWNIRNCKL